MTVKCWMFTWYQALMTPISHEENSGARTPREIERCRPPPCSQVAVSFSHFAPFWMDQLRLGNLEQPFQILFQEGLCGKLPPFLMQRHPQPLVPRQPHQLQKLQRPTPTNCRSSKEHRPHSWDAISSIHTCWNHHIAHTKHLWAWHPPSWYGWWWWWWWWWVAWLPEIILWVQGYVMVGAGCWLLSLQIIFLG